MGNRDVIIGRENKAAPTAEEQWRSLLESAPNYIFTVDMQDRITSLNRAGEGVPVEGVAGRDVLQFAPAQIQARLPALLEEARRTGETQVDEGIAVDPGGRARYVENQCIPIKREGKIISFVVVARDVSVRHRAQQALEKSERRFRAMIESGSDGITLIDASGVILYSSPSSQRILGYEAAEWRGRSWMELIHPQELERCRRLFARALAEPGVPVTYPLIRLRHKEGSWRWMETVVTNLLQDPSVGAVVANYGDVTERVRLEEQLRQSQKMEAIGLLAGGVAHDFNNLLTIVVGFTERLMHRLPADTEAQKDLGHVMQAARSAADLTHKLLAFSRRQILRLETVDLRSLVGSFGGLLGRIVGEDIAVEIKQPAEPLVIKGDAGEIQQVLLNLCTNARQAMPLGGKLRIETRRVEGGACELAISDSGVGMDKPTQTRIFEPFFTTKPAGTGLGLSVVFGIVQDHKGTVEVTSTPGEGTTFRIRLPLYDGTVQSAASTSPSRPRTGSETVLVAEDEPAVRSLLVLILSRLGYGVVATGDGEEAVAAFDRLDGQVDLALLDMIMPKLGGDAAAERMRNKKPDLRVVLMSGYAPDSEAMRELMARGGTVLLPKPFNEAQLSAKVCEVLEVAAHL